jgi:hypothetical protein
MVKETQRVTGGRATFAVLGSGLIIGTVVLASVIVISFATMGFLGGGGFANYGAAMGANFVATSISGELSSYTADHHGMGPTHAIELLGDGSKTTFIQFTVASDESAVPLGDTTLGDFKRLPVQQRRDIINDLIAAQPANVIAHRLGDVVFTYHSINFADADSKLWAFILVPEPGSTNWSPSFSLTIARVNGTTYQVAPDKFPAELESQNRLRAKAGLPPLPDDVLVITAAAPAVAAPPSTTGPDRALPPADSAESGAGGDDSADE